MVELCSLPHYSSIHGIIPRQIFLLDFPKEIESSTFSTCISAIGQVVAQDLTQERASPIFKVILIGTFHRLAVLSVEPWHLPLVLISGPQVFDDINELSSEFPMVTGCILAVTVQVPGHCEAFER